MNIAILTTARSDFGPLKRVIRCAADHFHVDLLIAGSHFLESRGYTFEEIKNEFSQSLNINFVCFNSMVNGNTPQDHINTLTSTQQLASSWFEKNSCDLLLFLGDRWELWGVTMPAFIHSIPLAHISGGEVTEGVIDDAIRHSHSKLSALHFVATNVFAENLSRMGEEDWRINIVGECGIDQIFDSEISTPSEIKERFGIDPRIGIILVTYHPSTLDLNQSVEEQVKSLLQALESFSNYQIVITAPGMEKDADIVMNAVKEFDKTRDNVYFIDHLGSRNYLAVMREAKVVVGNSSSGLVEASSFGVPTVNIGARQRNRIAADSVLHVGTSASEIISAIHKALSADFQDYSQSCPNPYDPFRDGKNSERIIDTLAKILPSLPQKLLLMKKFDNDVYSAQWNTLMPNNPQ